MKQHQLSKRSYFIYSETCLKLTAFLAFNLEHDSLAALS